MRWLDKITDSMDMILSKLWEIGKDRDAWHTVWGHKELGKTYRLSNKLRVNSGSLLSKTP